MRSIYLQYAEYDENKITTQIKRLNDLLGYAVPTVYKELVIKVYRTRFNCYAYGFTYMTVIIRPLKSNNSCKKYKYRYLYF